MSMSSKKKSKQNSFLRFFSILSRIARTLPKHMKRNTVVVCAGLVTIGVILSAVTAPQMVSATPADEKEQTATTAPVTQPTTAPSKSHKIEGIPVISQDYYKAGCESYACTMLLQGLGYDIDEFKFVENYLITSDFSYDEAGIMYGPDMNSAFAGNAFSGAGIFCPAMAKSMNRYLDTVTNDKRRAYPIKGKTLEELCREYIDKDIPVMTWVTTYMEESYVRLSWIVNYIDENAETKMGDMTSWRQNEHCMVLIGYTDKDYIFCDSVAGKVVNHDKKLAETRFTEIGNQAVVVK